MQTNIFNLLIHLLGDLRYKANCTLAATHGGVACMDVGEVRGSYGLPALSLHKHIRVQKQGAVSFATPWNRTTIPRRGALPCATSSAPFTSSNRGF